MLQLNVQQYQFRLWMKKLEKGGMNKIVQIFRRERFSANENVCGNLVVYQTKLPAFPHTQLRRRRPWTGRLPTDWTLIAQGMLRLCSAYNSRPLAESAGMKKTTWSHPRTVLSVVISALTGTS